MQDKPRIHFAITTFYPLVGGSERQTLVQCQKLIEKGHQVRVVTFRHDHTWLPKEIVEGVPVMRVAGLFLGRRASMPRLLQKLMYLLAMIAMSWTLWKERKKYDVLQVRLLSQLVLPLAIVCLLARKPMIIVLISAGIKKISNQSVTRTLMAGPLDPNTPWLKFSGQNQGKGDIYLLKSAGSFIFNFTRYLLKSIKAVLIVLSTEILLDLKENDFHLPGTRLIPNGVDIVHFHPASTDLADNEQRTKTVVCPCRLNYEKGVDVLLQAWRLVQEQAPASRLIIVGEGILQQSLQMLADALNITQSVEFVGRQSDIPSQLHRGTITVLPSRTEGMPNALLEAMACGCACVATRVSGSEDLIQHAVNGHLVEVEDYEGMAQALLTFLRDPDLARKYGRAARATVENHYALEHINDTYVELYYSMVRLKQQAKQ